MPYAEFTGELDAPQENGAPEAGGFVPFSGELDKPRGVMEKVGDELGQLRDEFFSGVDNTIAAFKTLGMTAQASQLNRTRDQLAALEAAGKGDTPEAEGLRKTAEHYTKRLPQMTGAAAGAQAQAQRGAAMTTRPAVAKLNEAKTWGEAWDAFKQAPYDVIAGTTASSLPATLPALVVAGVTGPAGGAAVMGLNSGAVEAGNSVADYARDRGIDPGDQKQVESFFADRDNLREALAYAGKRAGIIGSLDAASGGIAGKTIAPAMRSQIARQAVNIPAQMGVQAGLGAAGEAGGQLATEGRIDQPGQVLAEAVGELGGAPAEVAAFSKEARDALRPRPKVADVLKAPDVDTAIQKAGEVLALPAPGTNTADVILGTAAGEVGTPAQIDAMRRQRDIREGGAMGTGRNADVMDVVPREPAPAALPPASPAPAADPAALLERQAAGDPMGALLEARRVRTEALDAAQEQASTQREAELAAIPERAAEQNATQAALQRAATLEAPTAMQLALERGIDRAIGPEKEPPAPAPRLPRIVQRTPGMVAVPQKLAEQRAAATGGEVVRIRNQSGKFAFTVIPKATDAAAQAATPAAPAPADSGVAPAGAQVQPQPAADGAGGADAVRAAEAPAAAVVAPAAAAPRATLNASGTLTVQGDRQALTKLLQAHGITQILPAKGGVQVGRAQAQVAQRVLAPFLPATNPTTQGEPDGNRATPAAGSGAEVQEKAAVQGADANAAPAATAAPAAAAQGEVAPPAGPEPAAVWFGRRGDGYSDKQAALNALPARQRAQPDLVWQVEQTPGGKFRLAGYAAEEEQGAAPAQNATGQDSSGMAAQGKAENPAPEVPAEPAPTNESTDAPAESKPAPLDHGVLNIPGRTNGIDAELDRYKAAQDKQARADAKQQAAERRDNKARAKELFAELWPAMKEKMAGKFGEKNLRETLDSMVKWEPAKFVALAEKFQREQAGNGKSDAFDSKMNARGDNAAMTNKAVGESFRRMFAQAPDDLASALFNWNGVELSEDGEPILYVGRDRAFSKGKEGGKGAAGKREFLDWLRSDAPLDPKKFDVDEEWRGQIERLRSMLPGAQKPDPFADLNAFKRRMTDKYGERWQDKATPEELAENERLAEAGVKNMRASAADIRHARDSAQRRSDEPMPSGLKLDEAREAIRNMRGARVADVQKMVGEMTAGWKNGPEITVVQTASELPGENPSDVRGMYQGGHVWIVAGAHRAGATLKRAIARTLAHEAIAHAGLRQLLGREAWNKLMANIQMGIKAGNKELRRIQAYVQDTYVDDEGAPTLAPAEEADEIAAKAVEEAIDAEGNFRPGFGFLKAAWAQVAQFLRDIGITVSFSNAELQGMLVLAMRDLQAGQRTAGGAQLAVAAAREEGPMRAVGDTEADAFDSAQHARSTITGKPLPQSWQAPDPTKLDDLIYTLQDKHVDTKRAVQAVRDSIGTIADEQDPYLQEELFHGRAAKATKDFLDRELKPLLVDMQSRGVELSDFEEYLHNRHAERRNVQVAKVNPNMQDGGSGIKTKDARAYLANLPADKRRAYDALAKRIDAITKGTRDLLVDSGLEKQDTINAWDAAYGTEYVPLMREEMDDGRTGLGQGYSVRGPSSKRAAGSNKPVADILANIAMQRERTITRAEKRRVGEALYGLVLKAPNEDFWLAVDPALQQDPKHVMQTQMQLIAMGLDPVDAESIAKEPVQRYVDPRTKHVADRVNPAMRSAENVLAVRIEGEDKFVFFNAKDERAMRMVRALKNLDADQLGTAMGYVAKMTRWFASVNTQYNPIFGVTNITRDVQTALLNLASTPLAKHKTEVMKHVLPALRGIYIDLRDHHAGKTPSSAWANLFEEFQNEGGATGYRDMYANAQERADEIVSELRAINSGRALKLAKGVFDWLSDYNEAMENAVRVSAYKVGIEQGLTKQQAASLAKNLTVNFNRKGQVALQAGALYAFFNASVQGTARIGQTMFKDGKLSAAGQKIVAGGLLLGVMQALLLAGAGFDDDEPPDFVRERSLVIPIGGSKYVAIPMPLGFHVIPNLGRIPTEWAMSGFKNTTKRVAQLLGLFADAFNPIGSAGLSLQTIAPTVIDPLAALAENKDWTGKPIAKKDFDSTRPTAGHARAKDTATPWAKMISYAVNIATGGTDYKPGLASPTPDQIDYLIGQVTGGVGREVGKLAQVASGAMSGEDVPLHKIPLVGRFVGTTEGQAAEAGRFYENLKEIGAHKVQIDGLRKDHRGSEVGPYVRENPTATLVPMATAVHHQVTELQKRKRALIAEDASRERVKLIDQQITARMKALNDRVRKLEKPETVN